MTRTARECDCPGTTLRCLHWDGHLLELYHDFRIGYVVACGIGRGYLHPGECDACWPANSWFGKTDLATAEAWFARCEEKLLAASPLLLTTSSVSV